MAGRAARSAGNAGEPGSVAGGDGGSDSLNGHAIDPDIAVSASGGNAGGDPDGGSAASGEAGKRKRGRPPGSRNKSHRPGRDGASRSHSSRDVSATSQLIYEGHAILGALAHPALALTKEEADNLAAALQNVQRHYPGAGMLSEKHMALVGLAVCCGRIYAPRAAIVLGVTKPPEPARAPEPEGPRNIVVDAPLAPVADPGAWFDPGGAVQ